jgi:hypothetical protein
MLERTPHHSHRHFRAAKLGSALAVGAGLLLLWIAAPANAADQSVGPSASYDCGDYHPGDLCSCEGGHNSASCMDLKKGGFCSDGDGLTILCCRGSTCECRIGGANPDETCPKGSTPNISRSPGSFGSGITLGQTPPKAVAPSQIGETSLKGPCDYCQEQCIADRKNRPIPIPGDIGAKECKTKCAILCNMKGATPVVLQQTTKPKGEEQPAGDPAQNPEPTEPVRLQTQQPAPTKPGYIWVDDHWERKRAE